MANKTYNGLPLLEATINADHHGIDKISLVDFPAVESDFMTFGKKDQKMMYAVQNEEKRIVRGVVMRADYPIYRNDESGEYYVVYTSETIREMAEKLLVDGKQNDVNIMHEKNSDVDGVNMVQFFIKDVEHGINPEGFDEIENGSLFAEFHVCNDEVWDQIKAGEYKGFSLEGWFKCVPVEQNEEMSLIERTFKKLYKTDSMSKLAKFKTMLAELLSDEKEVKLGSMTTDKAVLSWEGEEDLKQGDEVFVLSETGERSIPEDGEYATEDKIYVIAGGKVTEIKDKPAEGEQTPAEGSEEKNAEQFAEEQKEGEEEKKQSLEDRVAQIENVLEQLCDYFGILRLRENEVAELRSQIEELKKTPAGEPAHKSFSKMVNTEPTGNKGIDNLRKIMES